ncbi:Rpp14/Pop5 family-domain-containing protein [Hyaloscypha finlandica]|nr:Rpp14/Pop5 family-domain-containing protein [Hyaloscypha sp. PMI_1271]KAH8795522.1 Rpp14/Pop5 family-domain-containing protein [Hyaloscypha finlandica]
MVRLKNRYLLVNVLYPELEDRKGKTKVPDIVEFNQPTTDAFTTGALLKGLKAEIANIFGDYGSGAVSESLTVKYLSPATSTFILRVSRAHYRLAWAALSLMTSVPVKDGKNCVFRVVRVSGTIRKAEEEAIRRARELILKARREIGEKSDSTLDDIFGGAGAETTREKGVLVVDRSDSEEEEDSDGDG